MAPSVVAWHAGLGSHHKLHKPGIVSIGPRLKGHTRAGKQACSEAQTRFVMGLIPAWAISFRAELCFIAGQNGRALT